MSVPGASAHEGDLVHVVHLLHRDRRVDGYRAPSSSRTPSAAPSDTITGDSDVRGDSSELAVHNENDTLNFGDWKKMTWPSLLSSWVATISSDEADSPFELSIVPRGVVIDESGCSHR